MIDTVLRRHARVAWFPQMGKRSVKKAAKEKLSAARKRRRELQNAAHAGTAPPPHNPAYPLPRFASHRLSPSSLAHFTLVPLRPPPPQPSDAISPRHSKSPCQPSPGLGGSGNCHTTCIHSVYETAIQHAYTVFMNLYTYFMTINHMYIVIHDDDSHVYSVS